MRLGSRVFATGDTRLITVHYKDFLERGAYITATTVSVPAGTVTTVGTITYTLDKQTVRFVATCGATQESFTITVQTTDSRGQIVVDTIGVQVTSP